jgi:hypothetical protein
LILSAAWGRTIDGSPLSDEEATALGLPLDILRVHRFLTTLSPPAVPSEGVQQIDVAPLFEDGEDLRDLPVTRRAFAAERRHVRRTLAAVGPAQGGGLVMYLFTSW